MPNITWEEMKDACPAFNQGRLLKLKDGQVFVNCGSRWAGEKSATLLSLFRTFHKHVADKDRCDSQKCVWGGATQPPEGTYIFFGNFEDVSFCFSVYTDSKRCFEAVMKKMRLSIARGAECCCQQGIGEGYEK